jgi:hypothetical protein
MKKLVLLAIAFIFSLSMMAQLDTKPKANNDASKVPTKVVTKPQTTEVSQAQVTQTQPAQNQPSPDDVIKMNTIKHDFGKIPQGKPVVYSFEIKNISNKPVVVENTYASCGCTTPDKIVEPIAPGATVPLKVQYSAAGVGTFAKQVHIKLAGITQEKVVDITGEVTQPETPATPPTKPNN